MARKRVRLHTVGHVLSELGRQYRRADNGDLGWQDAAAASRVLREMRVMLEASALEQRIEALEVAVAEREPHRHANGHDRHARR